jgi:hypothetical protein
VLRIYLSSAVGTMDQFETLAVESSHRTPEKATSHYSPLLPFVSGTVEEFRNLYSVGLLGVKQRPDCSRSARTSAHALIRTGNSDPSISPHLGRHDGCTVET